MHQACDTCDVYQGYKDNWHPFFVWNYLNEVTRLYQACIHHSTCHVNQYIKGRVENNIDGLHAHLKGGFCVRIWVKLSPLFLDKACWHLVSFITLSAILTSHIKWSGSFDFMIILRHPAKISASLLKFWPDSTHPWLADKKHATKEGTRGESHLLQSTFIEQNRVT